MAAIFSALGTVGNCFLLIGHCAIWRKVYLDVKEMCQEDDYEQVYHLETQSERELDTIEALIHDRGESARSMTIREMAAKLRSWGYRDPWNKLG